MDERRVRGERVGDRPDDRELLVLDADRRDGGLRGGLVDRGDRRDRLADVAHTVDRDDRPVLDRVAEVGVDVHEVGAREDRHHAGHRLRGRRVDRDDARVGSGLRRTLPWSIPGTRMSPT